MNLIKYLIPLLLLACKAKIEHDKISVINHKSEVCDTCEYRWKDEFTPKELNELNLK
jgi:hypothetical protein